jgi:hypothetical protein
MRSCQYLAHRDYRGTGSAGWWNLRLVRANASYFMLALDLSACDRHKWGPSSYLCAAYTHRLDTVLLFTEVFVSCKSLLFLINLNRGHGPLSPIYKYFVHVCSSCIYLPHLQLLFQFKHSSCIKVLYLYYAFVNDPSWPRRPPIHLRSRL